ncbi:hypothetical protein HMPREF0645_1030 [Hallella bergensis DSM 17361]|uniref:Uncharacterized protein n=1 Tax=Hallella bergensis DSM 17361 TaxID=585502 RepID=D1PVP5_9BACT|nr:hypothetical protein HMPREF0645_1030 [Hallella bergensis DSM 17361]
MENFTVSQLKNINQNMAFFSPDVPKLVTKIWLFYFTTINNSHRYSDLPA